MTGLRSAIGFLTILPVPAGSWQPARAVAWYPAVGVGLAAAIGGFAYGAFAVAPPQLAAALAVAGWVVLTGGLHLDGLADTADAAFAQVSRERRLEILRDVHHGTFAILAVGLVLLVEFAALAGLEGRTAAAAAALAVVAGRTNLLLVMRTFPRARTSGMGAASRAGATGAAVVAGVFAGLAAGWVTLGWAGVGLAFGAVLFATGMAGWLVSRFGGLTGDTYGAIVECVETAVVLAASILMANGHAAAFPEGGLL